MRNQTPFKKGLIISMLLSCFLMVQCKKDPTTIAKENTAEKQVIKEEALTDVLENIPAAYVLDLDWKKAKQSIIKGNKIVRVAVLNTNKFMNVDLPSGVDFKGDILANKKMGTKMQSTTNPNDGTNPNYYVEHPPELFFVQRAGSNKINTYLLNFVPTDRNKEFGQNNLWTGKLYEWNLKGDSLWVQDINKSKLVERYGLKREQKEKSAAIKNIKDFKLQQQKSSNIFKVLADMFGDVIGWFGHVLGLPTYKDAGYGGNGGYRINWPKVFGPDTGDVEAIDHIAGGDVYGSFIPGYYDNGTWEQFPTHGPSPGGSTVFSGSALYLIQNLPFTNTDGDYIKMDYLARNVYTADLLAEQLFKYNPTYNNKMYVYRAITYLNNNYGSTYEDFEAQYEPLGSDVVTHVETNQNFTYENLTTYFETHPDVAEAILAGEEVTTPGIPVWLIINDIHIEAIFVKRQHPNWSNNRIMAAAAWNVMSGRVHFVLDGVGLVPVVGEAADLVNGAIYFVEGDRISAAMSVGAAIPVWGWVSTGGKWVRTGVKVMSKPISEAAGKVAFRAFKTAKGSVRMVKVSVSAFSHAAIDALAAVVPANNTLTNLSRQMLDQLSHRINPTVQSLKSKVDDIVAQGDALGTKTEDLADEIFATNGFVKHEAKIGSNNGFDGVYIKKDGAGNVQEIIINEAKQVGADGSIKLNARTPNKGPQMSNEWIGQTIEEMKNNSSLGNLGTLLELNRGKITKVVTGVDKTTSEIVILKLSGY